MKPKSPIKHKKRVFTGRVVRVDQVDLDFGAKPSTFELISFNVATGVSALPLHQGKLLLIQHYQVGIDDIGWSLPTGGLHPGEDPKVRMDQELQEEIGYKAGKLTLMARPHTLPGYIGTQPGYLYLAQDLTKCSRPGDEPYPIKVIPLTLKQALSHIRSGRIQDARTILAVLYYVQFFKP